MMIIHQLLLCALMFCLIPRRFVKFKKLKKIREKIGSGWEGQALTRIFFFFLMLCFFVFFCVVFMCPKKNWIWGWVGAVWSFQVFLGFFFNLTRPLSHFSVADSLCWLKFAPELGTKNNHFNVVSHVNSPPSNVAATSIPCHPDIYRTCFSFTLY